MEPAAVRCHDRRMEPFAGSTADRVSLGRAGLDRLLPRWEPAAGAILGLDLWCTIEVCTDVPAGRWEQRLAICLDDLAGVAVAVADWIAESPGTDARIAGCTRDNLGSVAGAPTALVHVAL